MELILGAVAHVPLNEMTKELAIQSYMADPEARAFVNTHFAQLKSQGWMEGMPFDGAAFTEAFLQSVNSDVRPLSVVALHDLIEGKVTQGSNPVAKYNEHFHQRARLLPHESQQSLCLHYLNGLTPELRTRCCLDRNNNRWSSLNALVTFTLAEEERLNLTTSIAPNQSKNLNTTQAGRRHFHGKRASAAVVDQMDEDGTDGSEGTLAVMGSAAKKSKRVGSMRGHSKESSTPGLKQIKGQPVRFADGTKAEWGKSAVKVHEHPLFERDYSFMKRRPQGPSLSDQEKAELRVWYLLVLQAGGTRGGW